MLLGQLMQVDVTWTTKSGGCYSGNSGDMTNSVGVRGSVTHSRLGGKNFENKQKRTNTTKTTTPQTR